MKRIHELKYGNLQWEEDIIEINNKQKVGQEKKWKKHIKSLHIKSMFHKYSTLHTHPLPLNYPLKIHNLPSCEQLIFEIIYSFSFL